MSKDQMDLDEDYRTRPSTPRPSTPHPHSSTSSPSIPTTPDESSSGITVKLPPNFRAGQPVINPQTGKAEKYLTPHEQWFEQLLEDNPGSDPIWAPCSSELEWCLIRWKQKERIKNAAMDRLLAIPGVRTYHLNSSTWSNIIGMP